METESCQLSTPIPKSEKRERYAMLQSRKETLEAKLQERNNELKRLCIAEAELTGSLPPEIPLEPGEAVPTFRRRVGTSFTLPENLINKLKSEEEQSVSALELEFEIQSHITAAALQLANDCSAKKALRRQRRFEYQQNHRRLIELETRLNQLKVNSSQKHRKKPRPSVDNDSGGEPVDKELQDVGGILPSKSANALIGGGIGYIDLLYPNSTMPHNRSHSYSYSHMHLLDTIASKSQERLHATLSAPQYSLSKLKSNSGDSRSHRPHLQRLGSGGYFAYGVHQQGFSSPHYPTISSCAHPELERLNRHDTAFIMSPHWNSYTVEPEQQVSHQYMASTTHSVVHEVDQLDSRHLGRQLGRTTTREEAQISPYQTIFEAKLAHCNRNRFGSLDRKKHMAHSSPCLESRSVEGLDTLQVDVVDCASYTVNIPSKAVYSLNNVQENVTLAGSSTPKRHMNQTRTQSTSHSSASMVTTAVETLLPGQTYPEHSLGHLLAAPPDRGLTRTQSLGSVETPCNAPNADTRSIKDMYPSTSYTQQKNYDASLRKQKEKEWYETSLDSSPNPTLNSPRISSRRPSGHSGYEVKFQSTENHTSLSNSSCSLNNLSHQLDAPQENHSQTVPNDQQCPTAKSEVANEYFDTVVPFESPKNHMVIQAGKWQPYWEVTKPFEMSDFYKYSTKFRKKTECKHETEPSLGSPVMSEDGSSQRVPASPTPSVSPQQKGFYQPLQPMTCQPLDMRNSPQHMKSIARNKTLSPNASVDLSCSNANAGSLADAFSTEMLAWYQDQSTVPRSATLV